MWSSCGRNTSRRPAIEICVDSRAPLVPIGSLITCTVSVWPSKTMRSIGGGGTAPGRVVAARGAAVDVDVGDVQERGALEADVDERRLHPGQHARDLADVDVADPAALELAFEVQLLDRAVLDHGDARLLRRPVDEDVLHRAIWQGFRPSTSRPDVDARPLEQRGRLVQRQTHDTGVAALDPLDPGRGRALDRVRAGLAERLAAGDIALDATRGKGAKWTRETLVTRRVRPLAATATA